MSKSLEPITTLLPGTRSTGIGGTTPTRVVEAVLNLETAALPLTLTTLEPPAPISPIPSLLGRDILAHFALFLEERTSRVLLLEPAEADALKLPEPCTSGVLSRRLGGADLAA